MKIKNTSEADCIMKYEYLGHCEGKTSESLRIKLKYLEENTRTL